MSPLKARIALLIIKEKNISDILRDLQDYLNILPSQIPYLLEELKKVELINYDKERGRFYLTESGKSYLKEWNLEEKTIDSIEEVEYEINSKFFHGYIPKD